MLEKKKQNVKQKDKQATLVNNFATSGKFTAKQDRLIHYEKNKQNKTKKPTFLIFCIMGQEASNFHDILLFYIYILMLLDNNESQKVLFPVKLQGNTRC